MKQMKQVLRRALASARGLGARALGVASLVGLGAAGLIAGASVVAPGVAAAGPPPPACTGTLVTLTQQGHPATTVGTACVTTSPGTLAGHLTVKVVLALDVKITSVQYCTEVHKAGPCLPVTTIAGSGTESQTFTVQLVAGEFLSLHVTFHSGTTFAVVLLPGLFGIPVASPVVVGPVAGAAAVGGLVVLGARRRRQRMVRAA